MIRNIINYSNFFIEKPHFSESVTSLNNITSQLLLRTVHFFSECSLYVRVSRNMREALFQTPILLM